MSTAVRDVMMAAGRELAEAETRALARVACEAAARDAEAIAPRLLGPGRMMDHHIFPEQFRSLFEKAGIEIDNFTVPLTESTHLKGVHGRGLGDLPGGWNGRWSDFFSANPNATATEIYQFGGRLMDEFGLSGLLISPYSR
jgi:hypothetical protein